MLILLFFIIALIYSSVGFGGGSSYLALLLLFNFSYEWAPKISLICNIIVVGSSSFIFWKKGYVQWKFIFPFLFASVPFAFLGGALVLSKNLFLTLSSMFLLVAGILLLVRTKKNNENIMDKDLSLFFKICTGCILGFVSGLIGIGGGIFLSPILFLSKKVTSNLIISTTSVFILFNSFSGILGQFSKGATVGFQTHWVLMPMSVFIGGLIGNYLCRNKFNYTIVQRITSVLTLYASYRLIVGVL